MFGIALTIALVLAVAGCGAVAGSRVAAWITLAAALLWPFLNRPLEGPVLLVIGQGHGLTVSDLLTPAGVVVSVLAFKGFWHRSTDGSDAGALVRDRGRHPR